MNSPKTLAQVPSSLQPLQPAAAKYSCLSDAQVKQIDVCFRQNADCHTQLEKSAGHTDWLTIGIVIVLAGLGGYVLGSSH